MNFKLWLEEENKEVILLAQQARRNWGICDRAKFGDCKATSKGLVMLLTQAGRPAKLAHGYFKASTGDMPGNEQETNFEHSWVEIDGDILDPTVDQFFSMLDVDLHTTVEGIYYSHPDWDGDELRERYIN